MITLDRARGGLIVGCGMPCLPTAPAFAVRSALLCDPIHPCNRRLPSAGQFAIWAETDLWRGQIPDQTITVRAVVLALAARRFLTTGVPLSTMDLALPWLIGHGPIAARIGWHERLMEWDSPFLDLLPEVSGPIEMHAITVTGFCGDLDAFVVCPNLGAGWGCGGFACLPRERFFCRCSDAWGLVLPAECPPKPSLFAGARALVQRITNPAGRPTAYDPYIDQPDCRDGDATPAASVGG